MNITLETLPKATRYEIVKQVGTHMLRQGERSLRYVVEQDRMSCAYRGDNGLKCALGCLISDDEYTPELEGKSWRELVIENRVPTIHVKTLSTLQQIHDESKPENWSRHLRNLCVFEGLDSGWIDEVLNERA